MSRDEVRHTVSVDTRSLADAAATAIAAATESRTADSVLRIVTADDVCGWPPIRLGDDEVLPERASATYRGTTVDGRMEWVTNIHIIGRTRGKRGPVGEYRSVWYLASPTETDRQGWPPVVEAWAERHHPGRGDPDSDPTGSYL